MRAIGYVRLSLLTDETTSPERQRADITAEAARRGWELVDIVEDLGVSATRHRLNRPGLDEVRRRVADGEADAVLVTRLDRIARNVADVSELLDSGLRIAAVHEDVDATTPSGRAMLQIAQVFAQLEASTIGARVKSSRRYLPTVGRWPGGPTPYGFTTAPATDGAGRTLVHDPAEAAIVRRMADELLSGRTAMSIANGLNADGIPARRGSTWARTVVVRVLRSGAIRGYATVGGDLVRDNRGLPVVVWPPIIDRPTGRAIDRALTPSQRPAARVSRDNALLAGLAICSGCNRLMSPRTASPQRPDTILYVCNARSHGRPCPRPQTITGHLADAEAARQFLAAVGRTPVFETVQEAQEPEGLADVTEAIEQTTDAMRRPGADLQALAARLATLASERDRLASLPTTRPVMRPTGETYRDAWDASDTPARRDLMLSAEAYALIHPAHRRGTFTADRVEVQTGRAGEYAEAASQVL